MRRNNVQLRFRKRVFTDREKRRIRALHYDGVSVSQIEKIMDTHRKLIMEVLNEKSK